MARKKGIPYQHKVAEFQKRINPDAYIVPEKQILGPDCRRDGDVAIITDLANIEKVSGIVECKDLGRPVGIGAIDVLDSVSRDLDIADASICSDSGFRKNALRKAKRLGIGARSLLKRDDAEIDYKLPKRHAYARYWSVSYVCEIVHIATETQVSPDNLTYHGAPIAGWIHKKVDDFTSEHRDKLAVNIRYEFNQPVKMEHNSETVYICAISIKIYCSYSWISQELRLDATQASYDHISDVICIPNGESVSIDVDNYGWTRVDDPQLTQKLDADRAEGRTTLDYPPFFSANIDIISTFGKGSVELPNIDHYLRSTDVTFPTAPSS